MYNCYILYMNNINLKKFLPTIIVILIILFAVFMVYKSKNTEIDNVNDNDSTIVDQNEAPSDSNDSEVKVSDSSISASQQAEVNKLFDTVAKQQSVRDLAGAKITLEKIFKITPNDPNMMQIYASTLYNLGDKAGANVWIDKAISIDSKNINYWYLKFDFKKAEFNNDYNKISPIYLDAIKKTGNDFNMVTAYAQFLGSIGKKAEAIAQWQKAIQLNPNLKATYQAEIDALNK